MRRTDWLPFSLSIAVALGTAQCTSRPASAPPPLSPAQAAELRDELLEVHRVDQAMQFDAKVNPLDDAHDERMVALFRKNASRVRDILAAHGWPPKSAVGEKAEQAVFLVIDHADFDLPLQRRGLELLAPLVARDEAPKEQLALLTDRVRKNEGRPQVYGTQFVRHGTGRERIGPIEDEAHVDERRARMGLKPLDEAIANHLAFEKQMYEQLMRSQDDASAAGPRSQDDASDAGPKP